MSDEEEEVAMSEADNSDIEEAEEADGFDDDDNDGDAEDTEVREESDGEDTDDHDPEEAAEEEEPEAVPEIPLIVQRAKNIPRFVGPIEKLIVLGTETFTAGMNEWDDAEKWRFERECQIAQAELDKAGDSDGKKGSSKGKKKKGSSKKKKKSSKKKGKKVKVADADAIEKSPPSLVEMEALEVDHTKVAQQYLNRAAKLYVRAAAMCLASEDGESNEFYITCCLNAGEAYLRAGDDDQSRDWTGKALMLIDTPYRVSGASRVVAKELIVEPARVWWSSLWPKEEKAKKSKKGKKGKGKKKGSKKGSKKKGSKKGGKKKKK